MTAKARPAIPSTVWIYRKKDWPHGGFLITKNRESALRLRRSGLYEVVLFQRAGSRP